MSDNTAILAGYTQEYMAECTACDLHIFVKPDTDLDGQFKAYDADNCEFVRLNGWLWSFERAEG
jgi:hypothetical protein